MLINDFSTLHAEFELFDLVDREHSIARKLLKVLDTFGNCQRPVFPLEVFQHMIKITKLSKFGLNWSSKLQENSGRIQPCIVAQICVLSDAWERLQAWSLSRFQTKLSEKFFSNTTLLQRESFVRMFYTITALGCSLLSKLFCYFGSRYRGISLV